MKREQLHFNRGFSLIEVILAVSLFVMIVTAFVGTYLYGLESTALAGNRARAVLLAEEGLEVVRNIRDDSFSNLIAGTHGLATTSNEWILSGSSDVTDIYTREIEIAVIDATKVAATSTVTWQQNLQRTGTVALATYLTDWNDVVGQSNQIVFATSTASIGGGGNKELQNVTIENIGLGDVTISTITVTWDNSNLMEEIEIDNTRVWKHSNEGSPDGRQISGTVIDIEDYVVVEGSGAIDIDKIKFDDDMTGTIFTILLTMSDASTVSTIVDLSGGGGPSCGTQSDDFVISTAGANIAGGGDKELQGITVQNTSATCDVTIAKITLAWTNGQDIEEIKIEGDRIWKHNNEGSPDGRQSTGTEIDVVDYLITTSTTGEFDKFKFNGDMDNDTFTITFELSDGSTESTGSFSP